MFLSTPQAAALHSCKSLASPPVSSLKAVGRTNHALEGFEFRNLRLVSVKGSGGFSCRVNVNHESAVSTSDLKDEENSLAESAERIEGESADETVQEAVDSWLEEFQRYIPYPIGEIRDTGNQVSEYSNLPRGISRRRVLSTPMFMSFLLAIGDVQPRPAIALTPANIDYTKVPSRPFDSSDLRLQKAASIFQHALNAPTVSEEEQLWTEIIDTYEELDAEWVPDILARALGNRGNARSRQGRLEQALGDYDRSIKLAPYAVDPVLNRGVALESLGRLTEASADYEAVLHAQPDDPAAWNNLGNVKAAMRQWDSALKDYLRAVQLAPKFSFAAANYALILYQVGRDNEAVKQFRSLLRKYPKFEDIRAALAVSLYAQGMVGEAENNWNRMEDGRYRDREWVRNTRRWPPRLSNELEDFLDIKSSRVEREF